MALITKQGFVAIAGVIAQLVDCMYVEYTNTDKPSKAAGQVDYNYFRELAARQGYGYARIPLIAQPKVNQDGSIEFSGMLSDDDCRGAQLIDNKSRFYSVALVHRIDPDNVLKDQIIAVSELPVKEDGTIEMVKVGGINAVIRTKLNIG